MKLTYVRYEEIKRSVIRMFLLCGVQKIPIDCFEICEKMNIVLRPYSTLNEKALEAAKTASMDGFCTLNEGQWYIFYNDFHVNKRRLRFTLMHEIAHIVLDHSQSSELAEMEANFFAKYALAPPPLIHRIHPEDYIDIANRFDVSREFAGYAMSFYQKWREHGAQEYLDYELLLLSLFDEAV